MAASPSYRPLVSTASAPDGGHAVRSAGAAPPSAAMVPVACLVHGSSSSANSVREYTETPRRPVSSGASRTTRTTTASVSPSTSGASRVSSSTTPQPTWSPARIASSTKAVPGSRTASDTRWSASHGWVRCDSLPVNR